MSTQSQLTPFDLSRRLLKLGWDRFTEASAVQYTQNYVYDGDPDHPESHKKGEVRVYESNLHWFPDEPLSKNHYSMPTIYEAATWLREKLHVDAEVHRADTKEQRYTSHVYLSDYSQIECSDLYDKFEDALLGAIEMAVSELIKKKNIRR